MTNAIATIDLELVPLITRDALAGLDRLLCAVPPDDGLPAREVGALVRILSTVAGARPRAPDDANELPAIAA